MHRMTTFVLALAMSATACSRLPDESVKKPLPTRQAIDPVKKKLDAAAEDIERRRQDIDAAAK